MRIDASPDPQVVRAAGGLVWWRSDSGLRLVLIHRRKYNDWSFPKGKLEPGETWRQAAVREVREETGCDVRVMGFAGAVCYVMKGCPKVVMYWNMERVSDCAFQPGKEVDRLEWLSRREAMKRLNHATLRKLLNENRRR